MSGGSYQYVFYQIEQLAHDIRPTSALRKAFKAHMVKVAAACKAIEWVDSGDCGEGDEDDPIRICLGSNATALVLHEVLNDAEKISAELSEAIAKAKGESHE